MCWTHNLCIFQDTETHNWVHRGPTNSFFTPILGFFLHLGNGEWRPVELWTSEERHGRKMVAVLLPFLLFYFRFRCVTEGAPTFQGSPFTRGSSPHVELSWCSREWTERELGAELRHSVLQGHHMKGSLWDFNLQVSCNTQWNLHSVSNTRLGLHHLSTA